MENHAEWKAKLALFCYFGVIGGIFLGSIIVELVLLGLQIDYPGFTLSARPHIPAGQ